MHPDVSHRIKLSKTRTAFAHEYKYAHLRGTHKRTEGQEKRSAREAIAAVGVCVPRESGRRGAVQVPEGDVAVVVPAEQVARVAAHRTRRESERKGKRSEAMEGK